MLKTTFLKFFRVFTLKILTGFLIAVGLVGGVYFALSITGPTTGPTGSPATDSGLLKTFINSLVGPASNINMDVGDILTKVNSLGSGGGCYVSYSGGCLTGFTNKGSAGSWGGCGHDDCCTSTGLAHFRPPGGGCRSFDSSFTIGEAFVCCQ